MVRRRSTVGFRNGAPATRPGQKLAGQLSSYAADGSCRRIGRNLGDRVLLDFWADRARPVGSRGSAGRCRAPRRSEPGATQWSQTRQRPCRVLSEITRASQIAPRAMFLQYGVWVIRGNGRLSLSGRDALAQPGRRVRQTEGFGLASFTHGQPIRLGSGRTFAIALLLRPGLAARADQLANRRLPRRRRRSGRGGAVRPRLGPRGRSAARPPVRWRTSCRCRPGRAVRPGPCAWPAVRRRTTGPDLGA